MSSLSTSLKNSYQKWLHPYEEYLRIAKPGVHQMLEYENGGPLTPSPAPSPLKKSHQATPSSLNGDSPAMRASAALNATIHDGSVPPLETPRPIMSSGFTAVNSGGFTAVNAQPVQAPAPTSAANSFSAINAPSNVQREAETGQSTPQRAGESPLTSAKNTPDLRPSAFTLSTPLSNGQSFNSMKRQLSHDTEVTPNGDSDGVAGRRSKRLKKGKSRLCSVKLGPPLVVRTRICCAHLCLNPGTLHAKSHMRLALILANSTTCRCGADRGGFAHDSTPTANTSFVPSAGPFERKAW